MVGAPAATIDEHREVNALNEYLTATIGGGLRRSRSHDDDGNLTLDPTARNADDPCADDGSDYPGCETGQSCEYDEENRLTAVRRASDGGRGRPANELFLELPCAALGRRVETIAYMSANKGYDRLCVADPNASPAGMVVTRHVYAALEPLERCVCCDVSAPGGQCADPSGFGLAREFVWGEQFPEPLAMIDHTDAGDMPATGQPGGGPEVLHFLHDTLGSVVALTDSTGAVVERYMYDPYGKTIIDETEPATGFPNGDFHVIRREKDGWSEKRGQGPEGGPIDDADDHERNGPEGGRGRPYNGTYCCPQGKVKA